MQKPEKPTETLKGSWHQTDPLMPLVGIENWETSSSSWQRPTAAKPFTPSTQDAIAATWNHTNRQDVACENTDLFNPLVGSNLGSIMGKKGRLQVQHVW